MEKGTHVMRAYVHLYAIVNTHKHILDTFNQIHAQNKLVESPNRQISGIIRSFSSVYSDFHRNFYDDGERSSGGGVEKVSIAVIEQVRKGKVKLEITERWLRNGDRRA